MKYRSRTDITGLILEAANGGATKTKIMYKAFLSFAQLKEYLAMLTQNGLISYEDSQKYRTTEKGLRMLQIYNQINEELVISSNGDRRSTDWNSGTEFFLFAMDPEMECIIQYNVNKSDYVLGTLAASSKEILFNQF